jgi:hypothetical protein
VVAGCCRHVCGGLPSEKEISFLPLKKGGAAHSPLFFICLSLFACQD